MSIPRSRILAAGVAVFAAAALLTGCASGTGNTSAPDAAGTSAAPAQRPTATATPKPTAAVDPGVAAQLTYASTYWKNYNLSAYGDLNSVGGDCANFVSQTLIARGWKMNDQWYNHGGTDRTESWGYVPAMDDYFKANASSLGLQLLNEDQRSQYAVGDVVVFSWEGIPGATDDRDHVEIISKIDKDAHGALHIYLASHNNDGLYRDLDHQITVEHPGGTFHVWHLTRDTNS